ncbi:MAG: hypothetical protein IJX39_08735 [Clostridia bacterium]|nr:hypothetical protein [Clostridia bacterium]
MARFVQILRELAPYRTGNLALNAIRFEKTGPNSYKVYIHIEGEHTPGARDGIAPYQVFLNENPKSKHHQWWQAAIELALEEMANELGGKVEL